MKAINWFKENLLNINYQVDLDQVLRLEKSALIITDTGHINQGNQNAHELRKSNNSNASAQSKYKHNKHQREKNITNNNTNNSNDFIKITNNFFYDKNTNKAQDEDPNTLYYCERVLTEVDLDNTIEQEVNDNNFNSPISIQSINNNNNDYANDYYDNNNSDIINTKLRRSSSLHKRRSNLKKEEIAKKTILYSMKGLMLKRDSNKNILHTSIEEKGKTPHSNFYNIFKKFPKFNTIVKAKNKNRSSIENISALPHQKFNSNNNFNTNANVNVNNTHHHNHQTFLSNYHLSKGGGHISLKKAPHQHYPSYSINIHLPKNSNKPTSQSKYSNI